MYGRRCYMAYLSSWSRVQIWALIERLLFKSEFNDSVSRISRMAYEGPLSGIRYAYHELASYIVDSLLGSYHEAHHRPSRNRPTDCPIRRDGRGSCAQIVGIICEPCRDIRASEPRHRNVHRRSRASRIDNLHRNRPIDILERTRPQASS